MKKNDIIEIDYVAKIKNTGEVFDLTNEKKAKELNIYNKNYFYHPLIIILGEGFILKSLEDEILKIDEANIGKKYVFEFNPKQAFGERSQKLIKTFSSAEFRKKNITPAIGEYISFETSNKQRMSGKVISVSSGRICVDFNNVLAGKTVKYEVVINKIFKTKEEKIEAIIKMFIPKKYNEIKKEIINHKEVAITLPNKLKNKVINQLIEKYILKFVNGIEKVKFK